MHHLIEEYVSLCKLHYETDFRDKKAVRDANDAMRQMSAIVRGLHQPSLIKEFATLLSNSEYKINLWVAHHIVEQLKVDEETELKAMEVIKQYGKKEDDSLDDELL